MLKILHIISNLNVGGAETMLLRLSERLDSERFESHVLSLTDVGAIGEKIREKGIAVEGLGMRPGRLRPLAFVRLASRIRLAEPGLIHTWMYHADLMGGLASKMTRRRPPVIWGIRHSNLDPRDSKRSTILTMRACARLSRRLPRHIVCNSQTALKHHAGLGYDATKMSVIPNGFDLARFRPDPAARPSVREELSLPPETLLIGHIARFDPQKDHKTFIQAAGMLHLQHPEAHFLLCGLNIEPQNHRLMNWIEASNLKDHCHLLGRREDIPRLTAALDLAVSSSSTESFPQVLGEAMACGVPCVATDVGDSATIIGRTGKIVPPRAPEALAEALSEILSSGPETLASLGETARQRVETHYSLEKIVSQYETLYTQASSR